MIQAATEDASIGQLLTHSSGNINRELLIGVVFTFILAGLAYSSFDRKTLAIWLAACLGLSVFRFATSRTLVRGNDDGDAPGAVASTLFLVGLLLNALALAALPVLAALTANTSLLGMSLFCLFCLAAQIAACYPGLRLASLPFFILATLPGASVFLQHRIDLSHSLPLIGVIVGILGLLLINRLSLWLMLRLLHAEKDSKALHQSLDVSKQQIDKLTVGLKTNAEKRQQAEAELRRTAADLGLLRSKAKALADALQRVTPHDSVTGIGNEHHFQEALEREWRRVMRERKPISILYLDIDFYELYHETYGSQATDRTLTRIAKQVAATGKRSTDLAARIEDGKFKLLLPGADTRSSSRMAEQLRSHIEGLKIPFKNSPIGETLTVSVGTASKIPNPKSSLDTLNEHAKDALYEAGFRGGNKTVTFRAISDIKVEHWNTNTEGALSADGMARKVSILGYTGDCKVLKPGDYLADESVDADLCVAVLSGQLQITVEGDNVLLKHGDIMQLPAGTTRSMEVAGDREAHYLEATKMG